MNRKTSRKKLNKDILISASCAIIPLLLCLLRVILDGKRLSDVTLLNSEWNDELFYYKQVEAIINGGFPKGFFGFNESQAAHLSFAAWSPVLLFPWVLWGLIFGWNLYSPFVCNIVVFSVAMFIFARLVKPSTKKFLLLAIGLISFAPISRYLLSGMPEIIVISFLTINAGLFIASDRGDSYRKIRAMYIVSFILTLMRPYLGLFLLFPTYRDICVCRKRWIRAFFWAVGSLGIYFFINKLLAAPYWTDLFFTDWIKCFFSEGFLEGLRNMFGVILRNGTEVYYMMLKSFSNGNAAGAYFATFCMATFLWVINLIGGIVKKNKQDIELAVIEIFIHISMFFAILLMYKLTEGSKHLVTFIVVDLLLLLLQDGLGYFLELIVVIIGIWLFWIHGNNSYNYGVPYCNDFSEKIEALSLSTYSTMTATKDLSWDNVVIWTFHDYLVNGEKDSLKMVDWQYGYAIPGGFGINLCEYEYLREHIGSNDLKSSYIMTMRGGSIEALLKEKGSVLLASDENMCFYKIR